MAVAPKKLHFVVPVTPVPKGRPRFGKGFTYTPQKTRRFENELRQAVRALYNPTPWDCPIRLTTKFILKKPKRPKFNVPAVKPDFDNYFKAVVDSLNGVLWTDDALICEIGQGSGKFYNMRGPDSWIELTLEEITQ